MNRACFQHLDREGFALVTSLLIILVLSVIAVAAIIIATTEKRTSFAESVHATALFSADAGGERGIHFLRTADTPPQIIDMASSQVDTLGATAVYGQTSLQGRQTYAYECFYAGRGWIPGGGWGMEYANYDYQIESLGQTAAVGSRSGVRLLVSRIYREGY